MMKLLVTLLLSMSMIAVGCSDKGVGASTDTRTSQDNTQASKIDRTKTLSVEKRTTATVTVPVTPLIGEAWRELVYEDKPPEVAMCERAWMKPPVIWNMVFKDEATALSCAVYLLRIDTLNRQVLANQS